MYEKNPPQVITKEKIVYQFCGTESTPEEKQLGKTIFNSYCASCHNLKSDSDIVKPNVIKYTNSEFYEYVTNEKSFRNPYVPRTDSLMPYKGNYDHNLPLSSSDVENLVMFLK